MFIREEDGGATVDFVVLLATAITLTLSVMTTFGGQIQAFADSTSDYIADESNYGFDDAGEASSGSAGDDGETPEDDSGTDEDGGAGTSDDAAGSGVGGGNAGSGPGSGNPGNDADVGRAGENPSGKGGAGSGRRGRSG